MMNSNILNQNYSNLSENYLFSAIGEKVAAYQSKCPDRKIVRLGIGDVTHPLVPAVIEAMHNAVDEMANSSTFHGYGPEQGYEFLRKAIAVNEFGKRNLEILPDEILVSDGSKCDIGNFQELFSGDCRVAIPDPVYPVYLDSNVLAGRGGVRLSNGHYSDIVYMPCRAEDDFQPELPKGHADVIYLCSPNNPTGTVLKRETLERFVDYARKNGSIIFFDAAYVNFIQDDSLVHSIYEIPGAKECAVEFRSFSKSAGFTGVRCAFTVVPHELETLRKMWLRRQTTKFNGVSYVVQRAAEAVYSDAGIRQNAEVIGEYMKNATAIRNGLTECGFTVYGGLHAPYIWWKLPNGMPSFDFFDRLLNTCGVVGTPGVGFGPEGEGYFRLTAFGNSEMTREALERIAQNASFLRTKG